MSARRGRSNQAEMARDVRNGDCPPKLSWTATPTMAAPTGGCGRLHSGDQRTDGEVGIVHYGAEVITDSQNRLAALQGASPGASASVLIVPEVIFKCLYGGVCYGNSHMIGYRELSGCCEC